MGSRLRMLGPLGALGCATVVAILCPLFVSVELTGSLRAPPIASSLLLGGSSTLLAVAGCLLRQQRAVRHP